MLAHPLEIAVFFSHDAQYRALRIDGMALASGLGPRGMSVMQPQPNMNKPDPRAVKILAKSVYRELKASGYSRSDMVGFANALLELMTSDIRDEPGSKA
jgi:hypothetical protein